MLAFPFKIIDFELGMLRSLVTQRKCSEARTSGPPPSLRYKLRTKW